MKRISALKNKQNKGAILLTLAIGASMLTGCGNGMSNFQKKVEEGNYLGAAEEFAKSQSKSGFVSDASTFLLSYVGNIESDYGAGKITSEKALRPYDLGAFSVYELLK